MLLKGPEYVSCDVLVVGGGGAGLRAAITARQTGTSVVIASKSQVGLGNNTVLSKATFSAALGLGDARDNPDVYVQDAMKAGCYVNDVKLLKRMAGIIAEEIPLLQKMGVSFPERDGKIAIDPVPGHTYPRHVFGQTRRGSDLTLPLKRYASAAGVRFVEKVFITRLLTTGQGLCATAVDEKGCFLVFQPRAIVLATGGFCQIYLRTNNAVGITGDGCALALQAGIPLRDMEFVQFYPTYMGANMLSYETFVDLFGAPLWNSLGEDVVAKHGIREHIHMTRDKLARAIMREILEGRDINGGVKLDLRKVPESDLQRYRHFLPGQTLTERREYLVSPVAHFSMGGIVTDENAHTCIPGLFACGEMVGGMHGANRLAGNALAETFAMGRVAGEGAARLSRERAQGKPELSEVSAEMKRLDQLMGDEQGDLTDLTKNLKETMWFKGGIIREKSGMEQALEKIREGKSLAGKVRVAGIKQLKKLLELNNMQRISEIVLMAALKRQESRGAHYREDYPEEDPEWRAGIFVECLDNKVALRKKVISP